MHGVHKPERSAEQGPRSAGVGQVVVDLCSLGGERGDGHGRLSELFRCLTCSTGPARLKP